MGNDMLCWLAVSCTYCAAAWETRPPIHVRTDACGLPLHSTQHTSSSAPHADPILTDFI